MGELHLRAWRWKEFLVLALVLAAGGLISVLGYTTLHGAEVLRAKEWRSSSSQAVLDAFELDLLRATESVRAAALMMETRTTVDRAEFNRYVERNMQSLPGLHIMEWQPVVAANTLAQFENAARSAGLDGYQVVQPDASGRAFEPVRGRDPYVPILFAWPENLSTHGLDMSFSPERMASKLQAASTGKPVASGVFDIMKNGKVESGDRGIAISAAVRRPDGAVAGYLAAVLDLKTLFQEAQLRADGARLDLLVYDLANPTTPAFTWLGDDTDLNANQLTLDQRQNDQLHTLDFAGRAWEVVLHARPSFTAGTPQRHAIKALVGSLIATLVLAWFVARLQGARIAGEQAAAGAAAAMAQLHEERLRLQAIVEGTGAVVWDIDLKTGKLDGNERWATMIGYQLQELPTDLLAFWRTRLHPDDKATIAAAIQAHTAGAAENFQCEYRIRHELGHWIWIATYGRLIPSRSDPEGKHLAGINIDVTARKVAEARIIELNEDLERRVDERGHQLEATMLTLQQSQQELSKSEARATLGTLVAGVSHELGTPMGNAMLTATTLTDEAQRFEQTLAQGTLRRSELNDFIASVQTGNALMVRNLERAVELLKAFRQVAADQASEQRRTFDLRRVIKEVVDTLGPSLKKKPHKVKVNIADGIDMDSYPGPLGQVVINLVNNAYLHAFDDSRKGEFTIDALPHDTSVTLTFRDNGKGIPQSVLDKMFEPFFSTKIGKGGTGLGMSIVENLVTKTLQGSISVRSTLGAGTTVELELPFSVSDNLQPGDTLYRPLT
jgi:PAS domain S-box-containing protein